MGTRSRIILRRRSSGNVYLWMNWDGYFSGQGDRICQQLRLLLSKYSSISLQSMLDALAVEELSPEESQNFSAEHLADFLEGLSPFKNDPCEDVEFEYIVDFRKGLLLAIHNEKTFVVTFGSILDGFNVSQLDEYLYE